MTVIPYQTFRPKIDPTAFIAPSSWCIGQVTISKDVSIFFGAVLRGDVQPISIGSETNIQEHAVLHGSSGLTPCVVGSRVTVGHRAIIHGCSIEDDCIIGMGVTILDGAVIGKDSIVGAGALVTMNKTFPPRSLILGSPAKVVSEVSEDQILEIKSSARRYVALGRQYQDFS